MTIDVLDMVPEEGLEPSQPQGPRDFESRASTKFRHSGRMALIADARNAV